jgi:predicted ester cyclase
MTRDAIEQILSRHQEAFVRRDARALAATHQPDGTFESPAYGVIRGRPAIEEMYRYWYTAFPDFILMWESAVIDPPHAAFFWNFKGTSAGPFFGEVRPGTPIEMTGAAHYTFAGNGILAARHVFDFSGILVRTGVLKIKPA